MTRIFSVDSEIEQQRRENSTSQQRFVMLGDGRGNDPAVNLYADKQHLWARDIAGSSESGFTATGAPFKVLAGSNTSVWIGKYVWLSYQTGPKEWKVELSDPDQMTDIGMSMHLENPNDPHNQFKRTEALLPLRAQWIGGMKISVQGWQYVKDDGASGNYGGTSAVSGAFSEHVDATSFVPGTAAQHRYILVAFNTKELELGNDPLVVYASTPKSWFTALGKTDEDECLAQMGPRTVSIWLFRVATGDTDNRGHASDRDKRQWLNTPPRVLNITSEDESVTITEEDGTFDLSVEAGGMESFTVSADSGTPQVVEDGNTLMIAGGTGLSSVASATDTITLNLDNTAVTPGSYTNLNATIDAQGRITNAANGTAGMTSFTAAGETGTPQAIGDGNTLTIQGGDSSIDTSAANTDTLNIIVAPGGITTAKLADDAVTNDKVADNAINTAQIVNNAVTEPKLATNAVTTTKIANGAVTTSKIEPIAHGKFIGGNSSDATSLMPATIDPDSIYGQDLIELESVYLRESDGRWYKMSSDTDPSLLVGAERGLVTDTGSTGGSGLVRLDGPFTSVGLSVGPVYVGSTPGTLTQTLPTPVLDGETIAIIRIGYFDSTSILVRSHPVIYRRYITLEDGDIASITHHADPEGARRYTARTLFYDSTVAESYASSNQDTNLQLRGQSGAGATLNADTTGGTAIAVGDASGTEFRAAQSFTVVTAGRLDRIEFVTRANVGAPTGAVTVSLRADNAGNPATTSLWSTSHTWTASATNTISITDGLFLNVGDVVWVVWEAGAQGTGNRYVLDASGSSTYAGGVGKFSQTAALPFPDTWAVFGTNSDIRASIRTAAVTANDALAQGVSHSATITVTKVRLWLRKVGNPPGNLTVTLCADSSGSPGSTITNGTSESRVASELNTSYAWFEFDYPVGARPSLSASTQYHAKLTTSDSASNTNYIEWGTDSSSPSYANGQMKTLQSVTWAATSPASDGVFELYAQGVEHEEDLAIGQWSGGVGQIGVRRGDAVTGANRATITSFKNISGETQVCILDSIVP